VLAPGEWVLWIDANCDFGERTAQRYMVLARDASRVSHVPTVRDALAALGAAPSAPGRLRPPDWGAAADAGGRAVA
jgi:hypothetical protein